MHLYQTMWQSLLDVITGVYDQIRRNVFKAESMWPKEWSYICKIHWYPVVDIPLKCWFIHLQVCCPLVAFNNPTNTSVWRGNTFNEDNVLPKPGECGRISFPGQNDVIGFIVGGEMTKIYEAPWSVGDTFICHRAILLIHILFMWFCDRRMALLQYLKRKYILYCVRQIRHIDVMRINICDFSHW